MQDQTPEYEISKRPLGALTKLLGIFRVGLDAQTGREDELADSGRETGEESIEWLYERIVRCEKKGVTGAPMGCFWGERAYIIAYDETVEEL